MTHHTKVLYNLVMAVFFIAIASALIWLDDFVPQSVGGARIGAGWLFMFWGVFRLYMAWQYRKKAMRNHSTSDRNE